MINACQSKRCQQYLGFSPKIGLPVCLKFKESEVPVQYLTEYDKYPYYIPQSKEEELENDLHG